jgi:hypothetical protein
MMSKVKNEGRLRKLTRLISFFQEEDSYFEWPVAGYWVIYVGP